MKKLRITCLLALSMVFLCSCGSQNQNKSVANEPVTTEEFTVTEVSTEPVTETVTQKAEIHEKREFEIVPEDIQGIFDQHPEENYFYVYGTLSFDENGLSISKEDFYSSKAHMVLTGESGTEISCSFTDLLDQNNFDAMENEFAGHYGIENYADKKVYMYGSLSTGCRMINCRPLFESEVDDFYSSMNEHRASLSERAVTIDELEDAFYIDPYDAYLKYNFFRTSLNAFHTVSLHDIFADIDADIDSAFAKYDFPESLKNDLSDYRWYENAYNYNAFFAYDSTLSIKGKYFSDSGHPVLTCVAAYYDQNLTPVPVNNTLCYPGYMLYISDSSAESFKDSTHKFVFYDINEYEHLY